MNPPSRSDRGAPAERAAAPAAGAINPSQIERLRAALPGKESVIDELIDLFIADLARRLSALGRACADGDGPALALQAHALRGGGANLGAQRLDELCGRLEELGARGALAEAPAMLDEVGRESERVREALLAMRSPPRG